MEIQGHRGFGKLAPFNSIRAFNLASRLGLDSVEFDIRILKDKTLVVNHGKSGLPMLEFPCPKHLLVLSLSNPMLAFPCPKH